MADDERKKMSRRAVLKRAALFAGLATVPLVQIRDASAKVPKAAMQYRDHPNGKDDCSICQHFVPGKTPTAMGTCTVVAGAISPHGWCVAFSPKS